MPAKKKRTKKKSRSITTKTRGPKAIKDTMTKRQLVEHLADYVTNNEQSASDVSTNGMKKIVSSVLDGISDTISRSIRPGGVGKFMLPKMFKVTLKEKKAIRKGTMVRSPATGEMVPSKGRPASKMVKIRPLVSLKKAAAGID